MNSQQCYQQACNYLPGGVDSPVRAFKAVGGTPVFIDHAQGAYLYDVEGKQYIDYVGSWGPMILGHAAPNVVDAVQKQAAKGLSYGAPSPLETTLAELVTHCFPAIEKLRFVNSGTEATMSALRVARGYTGRNKILKFEGCYHGHADCLLVKAGSGALTFGSPSSPGVPNGTTQDTLVAQFNDLDSVTALFEEWGHDLAAVIVEPIPGNMNMIKPTPTFLSGLRALCDQYNSVLIFDEVMTGFRVALGGAQQLYQIKPDMTCLGKIIGGGMPVGAFGGRADIMQCLSPDGPVYQAGTLSGNPLAMVAGIETIKSLLAPGFFDQLEAKTKQLADGMVNIAQQHGVALSAQYAGGMFGLFFSTLETVSCFKEAMACDAQQFKAFFAAMLAAGIYLAPSAYEAGFMSAAHTTADIQRTLEQAELCFSSIKCLS